MSKKRKLFNSTYNANSNNSSWSDCSFDLDSTQNLVHPNWELIDPTPDIHKLFKIFDEKFFKNRLKFVKLEWSKRMYASAGICYTDKTRFGMNITIRLSEPLLKLRPRKDLVETILHEMIHAYMSVMKIKEGNGGHGVNFQKIMKAINKVAGTNITVYHTFDDEVDFYKKYWWRCNGKCRTKPPFYGYVKRTSNRAPGQNDFWWPEHLQSCGGSFIKIKEPESCAKKPKIDNNIKLTTNNKPITSYFPAQKNNNAISSNSNSRSKTEKWTNVDKKEEIMVKDVDYSVIEILTSDEEDEIITQNKSIKNSEERQRIIKQDILQTSFSLSEDDIKLLDDDYDDALCDVLDNSITDTCLIDDLFGEDALENFYKQNAMDSSKPSRKQFIFCPICGKDMSREQLAYHINICSFLCKCPVCEQSIESNKINEHLNNCLV